MAHRPTDADRPRRVAFVDGTLRTEARLTRTGPDGEVSMGLAGSWAAGAVLVDGDEPARFDQVTTGRAAIFTGGRPVHLPDHRDGWRWEPYAVDGADVEAARQQLQRLMRDAEADIAEALSNDGWLTVLDGPLHGIRHCRGLPVIAFDCGAPASRTRAIASMTITTISPATRTRRCRAACICSPHISANSRAAIHKPSES